MVKADTNLIKQLKSCFKIIFIVTETSLAFPKVAQLEEQSCFPYLIIRKVENVESIDEIVTI